MAEYLRLLTLLAAVGLLLFSAGAASVRTLPDGQSRVRVPTPILIFPVGVSEHITAGQGRGPPGPRAQIVVATGVLPQKRELRRLGMSQGW